MTGRREIGGIDWPRTPHVLLEDRNAPAAPATLYRDPVAIVRADAPDAVADAFARLEDAQAQGLHAAGFLSYELGHVLEPRLAPLLPRERALPLLWFGLFHAPEIIAPGRLDRALGALPPPAPLHDLAFGLDAEAHAARVRRVLAYLHAGDAYQINLTFPIGFRHAGEPLSLYAALRAEQPVAHGGLVSTGEATLLSVSPELFVTAAHGAALTRPMKGTAARGADPQADVAAAAALRADPKQRAENLMIVDLLRNDLGRISETGSVAVPELFRVETYPTLHTLTSDVVGRLRPEVTPGGLLSAMFPCGSVTGAPKIRAMEIIAELEDRPRGAYTGSIGAIAPDGALRFNVAIRTATLMPDGSGVYGAGGGIVVDSDPKAEYAECRLKARVLTDLAADYGLFETLRWVAGAGYRHLPLHLARLEASAALLGFAYDGGEIMSRLDTLVAGFDGTGDMRVRFEVRRDGRLDLQAVPLPQDSAPAKPAVLMAIEGSDAADPFARHKTTRRGRWERPFATATAAGFDDALLLNREGLVTETPRANVFLPRDGVLLTPPVGDGLLPGVLRRALIESGQAREASLRLADLAGPDGFLTGSSLRGLRPARLGETAGLASRPRDRE
ncbi:aminodeoxychorismate synthase component I [Bosea sp. TWI1241]|uniref:aminodeoxychorismate synthase component I n=1 Tax=Bosea sp. TWI1241 TaxID=3148904 RepID=UPI003209E283